MKKKRANPAGGFGPRYGVSVRRRWVDVISEMKKKHPCPRCGMKAVRRVSVGIWACRKCGFRFAGGAYTPRTKISIAAERSTQSR
ncbi:50S ribosomal protein L37ae [Candidatus Bathyarchaeota archaeon]|nr:50S ribosomal protein L37ae [Candidatus Bathyarchaeota archaeon]